ncbi:transglycosylase family protein, partial [Nocardia alni]|uniref:transglycosylase family protein n=1 Tax=Nocardia alni TaxID=2815723 RepID=UPI001C21116B
MSGRHRKPTSTSRTVAKVAVTSAIMGGAGAVLAGHASAATDQDWDSLAQCESGGNWAIDTGNGFHGGLQFTPSTWRSFGGDEYASSPENASRDQQIAVGEKVLATQGWGAWPSCSHHLGLHDGATMRDVPSSTPHVESAGYTQHWNPAQSESAPHSQAPVIE